MQAVSDKSLEKLTWTAQPAIRTAFGNYASPDEARFRIGPWFKAE